MVRAWELPAADPDGSADPYVCLRLGTFDQCLQKERTKTKKVCSPPSSTKHRPTLGRPGPRRGRGAPCGTKASTWGAWGSFWQREELPSRST